jgi:hypothetical protein
MFLNVVVVFGCLGVGFWAGKSYDPLKAKWAAYRAGKVAGIKVGIAKVEAEVKDKIDK